MALTSFQAGDVLDVTAVNGIVNQVNTNEVSPVALWAEKTWGARTSPITLFSNLEIGKTYSLSVNVKTTSAGNNANDMFTISGAVSFTGGSSFVNVHGNRNWQSGGGQRTFVATSSSITLTPNSDDWGTAYISGHAILEEKLKQNHTTQWDS